MNFGGWEIILISGVLVGLFFPIAVLGFVAIKFISKSKSNLKKCPFCAETIQSQAIICRYCNRDLMQNE